MVITKKKKKTRVRRVANPADSKNDFSMKGIKKQVKCLEERHPDPFFEKSNLADCLRAELLLE